MKRADIETVIERGRAVAIEHLHDEAHVGHYGLGKGVVKATPLEVGIERRERYGSRNAPAKHDGVRLRVEETFRRVWNGAESVLGFEELPAGHEVVIPSRQVLRPWGERPARPGGSDDDVVTKRACRYAWQDEVREGFTRLGVSRADYAGDTVKVPLAELVGLVRVTAARDEALLAAFIAAVKADLPWTGLSDIEPEKIERFKREALVRVRAVAAGVEG